MLLGFSFGCAGAARFRILGLLGFPKLTHSKTAPGTQGGARGATKNGPLPPVDWMRKDLGLVLDEAGANGARLETTTLIDGFYRQVQEMGGQRWDTSSLVARLEKS